MSPQQMRDVSAWTEQTVAHNLLGLSEPPPSGLHDPTLSEIRRPTNRDSSNEHDAGGFPITGTDAVPLLTISHDDEYAIRNQDANANVIDTAAQPQTSKVSVSFRRKEKQSSANQRDSTRRREALLKGKDGSRRRQRWENDRLLNNPWAEPPSPDDWLVQPTYPRHNPMPYYLAPLWDVHSADNNNKRGSGEKDIPFNNNNNKRPIPRELRMRLKRARSACGMLKGLEEDIRGFLQRWNDKQLPACSSGSEEDYSDDEVVFVGRKAFRDLDLQDQDHIVVMTGGDEPEDEKMVSESRADDRAAAFG